MREIKKACFMTGFFVAKQLRLKTKRYGQLEAFLKAE